MFYLSKILPVFVLPLGLVCLLLVGAFFLRNRWISFAALVLLYTSSLPPTGRFLVRLTEAGQVRLSAGKAATADAIVVLSGGRGLAPGPDKISEWHDADRFFGGIELFAAGKAPVLVFTGGASPWEPSAPTEGEILRRYAAEWGVPDSAIKVTDAVFNTQDEAKAVAGLMSVDVQREIEHEGQHPKILLVTSAFHMPRARAVFEAEGFSVEPFAVDFLSSAAREFDITDLLPSPQALSLTTLSLREFLGRLTVRAF